MMRGWLLLLVALPGLALAQMPAAPQVCSPTPNLKTINYPGARNIPTSNDLTQYSGKAVAATGQRLILQFRVRDPRCVPVQNAIIEIWQADPFGNWRLLTDEQKVTQTPAFSGAGRGYTDNNGGVQFITLFPAGSKTMAPHIYVRVKAPDMGAFDTIFYFSNDVRNGNDATYKKLSGVNRNRLELSMTQAVTDPNSYVASGEIILPSRARYRSY